MPELPEVETTLRGVAPYLLGQTLTKVTIRVPKLRLPTPSPQLLQSHTITQLIRRNKYLLGTLSNQHTLLIHLGMSGRLTLADATTPLAKHDHVILSTAQHQIRFNDPRRFGLFLIIPTAQLTQHPLLAGLGPEPLTPAFTPAYLHAALRNKRIPIKVALMDNHLVCGVGNIYASESLFVAGLNPHLPAHQLSRAQCTKLVPCVQNTLTAAIAAGGSTLNDYRQPNGAIGYFHSQFKVYGRAGQPCFTCGTPITSAVLAQRNTFWCPTCQPRAKAKRAGRP